MTYRNQIFLVAILFTLFSCFREIMAGEVISHTIVNPFTRQPVGEPALEFTPSVDLDLIPPGTTAPKKFLAVLSGKTAYVDFIEGLGQQPPRPSLLPMIRRWSEYRPSSVVYFEDTWYLRAIRGTFDDYTERNNLFFRFRDDKMEVAELTGKVGCGDLDWIHFFQSFRGLRKCLPTNSGHFEFSNFQQLSSFDLPCDLDAKSRRWLTSRCVYFAGNGSILLLNKDGQTAWFNFELCEVFPYSESFEAFTLRYLKFSQSKKVFDDYTSLRAMGGE